MYPKSYLLFIILKCTFCQQAMALDPNEFYLVNDRTSGMPLCANNAPNSTHFSKSSLRCSSICSLDNQCFSYNWKPDINQCEFFNRLDMVLEEISPCQYYRKYLFFTTCCVSQYAEGIGRSQSGCYANLSPSVVACPADTIIWLACHFHFNPCDLKIVLPIANMSYKHWSHSIIIAAPRTYLAMQKNTQIDNNYIFNVKLWEDYAKGFGTFNFKYWLGNRLLNSLTVAISKTIKMTVEYKYTITGKWNHSNYDAMSLSNEASSFTLLVSGYHGSSGYDSITHLYTWPEFASNNQKFSTYDRDNDKDPIRSCADATTHGGWWFNMCAATKLNAEPWSYWIDNQYTDNINNFFVIESYMLVSF